MLWLLTACGPDPTATLFADVTDQDGQVISIRFEIYDLKETFSMK